MADSFQPWIGRYLIDMAEMHGANLTAIPYFEKKKKVQLVEFITYNLNTQDDCIWGKVSDKEYKIPVRFTKEAMSRYNSLNTRRLTEHKTALISITDFQPFFARIPLANNRGMSQVAYMALNIKSFSIIGSTGEAEWGRPQNIEANADLLQWSEGLRKDGGEGNVLMDRKKEREKAVNADSPITIPRKPVANGAPQAARIQTFLGSKASSSKNEPALPAKSNSHPDLLKEYERSWRPISLNAWTYALRPPLLKEPEQNTLGQENTVSDNVMDDSQALSPVRPQSNERCAVPRRHALDLSSSQPERGTPPNEHTPSQNHELRFAPTTPSEWSSSFWGDQAAQDRSEDEATSDDEVQHKPLMGLSFKVENQPVSASRDGLALPNTFTMELSSHLSPPTPVQRPKSYVPPTTSSPLPLPASFPCQTLGVDFLPAAMQSTPNYTRQKVMRKVPYPTLPPKSSMSGPAHILVPNSDTSGTTSQPQSQSKPTTQSILPSEKPILPRTQESKEQCSNVDNNFHSLFGVSPPDENKASDSDSDDESNDKDQSEQSEDDFDELQEEEEPQVEHRRSIVPDSQEGQLDEDDAQIDDMLFGPEECTKDTHSVKKEPPPTIQTPNEISTTNGTEERLHNLVDYTNKVPTLSRQLPHSRSKDAPQSPVVTISARMIATEQSSDSNIAPQHISVPSDIHPVEHNARAWATPSFMQNEGGKKKDNAFSLETSGRNGSPVGDRRPPLRTPKNTKKLSNSLPSGTDAGKGDIAPNGQPPPSKHIHTSTTPEIQGDIRAQVVKTAISSRDSSGLMVDGRRSHKRRREASPDDRVVTTNNGSKRGRLVDMGSPSRTPRSRQILDHSKGDSKRGQDATLRPTQEGGIKDEPFGGQFAGGRKLKGFQVNFDIIPFDDQKGWPFSWSDLERVLLQTGRKRDMEQKRNKL